MNAKSLLMVVLGVFLVGPTAIALAGGPSGKKAEVTPPIMAPTEYLEYLEIEKGLETGSLTAPGVHPGTPRHAEPAEMRTEASPPVMVTNDYLEYLEFEKGIETGSLTAPGVRPTEVPGWKERVEIPEGG